MALFGIIGKSLAHSFSPAFFDEYFKKNALSHEYRSFELSSLNELPALIETNPSLVGFNVTIPYKKEILKYLDFISDEAKKIGAVNTVVVKRKDGETLLSGYNTDVSGFLATLDSLNKPFKKAAILGTGGASSAVAFALRKYNIPHFFVSRNPNEGEYSYADLSEGRLCNTDLIINTTPLGMYPDIENMPEIPVQYLNNRHTVIDLIYNPAETLLLQKSKQKESSVVNGTLMLEKQAIKAWEIWKNEIC
jgi:shikimate dehydrogenase